MPPKVFIVILNYNGKEFLLEALSSVFRVNYPNFEIILVDNNSSDGSLELARMHFSRAIFIKNKSNLGFSAGNNVGIRYALERGADYILLLNFDTKVEKNFLEILVSQMEKDRTIGISSPLILEGSGLRVWFSGGQIDWLRMRAVHQKNSLGQNYLGSGYISGCAMLARAKVFKEIGLLDENYFLYYEDADFSCRAKKVGYKLLVCPKSRIYHLEKSEDKKERKIYWLVISGLIFFRKNTPFWLKPWIYFFTLARKLKNKRDLKRRHEKIAEMVAQAYQDFNYVK